MKKRTYKRKGSNKNVFIISLVLILILGFVLLSLYYLKGITPVELVNQVTQKNIELKKVQVVDLESNDRPIAVMINNHQHARPYHSGLQDAYIIYEVIAEGGYTRYMALFRDKSPERVGSIRSSRHYFLDYVLENDAIYVHWGWSPQAEKDIKSLDIDNIDGMSYEGKYFYRDKSLPVPLEHTGYVDIADIREATKNLSIRETSDSSLLLDYVVDDLNMESYEDIKVAKKVEVPYSGILTTSYVYNADAKVYERYINGEKHIDYVTKKQYTAKNIIVYNVSNYTFDSYGRQDIKNIGSGKGYYISNGYAVPIKWEKDSRSSKTEYTYLDGTELKVNDGNTYIQIQPSSKKIVIID